MITLKATIIVPTTGNRGALLPYSIGSIQNQTVQEIEIFIMGDGVTDETKQVIQKLKSDDIRIKFFDHPKHERRGEIYRHQALQEAKGEMVCYLCDRDLMLPDHVETMLGLLEKYNFVSTTFINVKENQGLNINQYISYYGPASENDDKEVQKGNISLSNVAHSLELYHQLPYGWRTTPGDEYTDIYMWKQFLAHPQCNAYSHIWPTILYFKRGDFPGASVEAREKELAVWYERISNGEEIEQIKDEAFKGLLLERRRLRLFRNHHPSKILIKGYTLKEVPQKILKKISNIVSR